MLVAFITIFLDLVGFGIVIPVQAFYTESFGASAATVTLLAASYSAMQFLFSPFWGNLSDRIGRRKIVLSSVCLSGLGHLAFGLAPSLPWLFAARMLAGFGNANIGTAQAIISDVTTPETRAKGMGLIGAAFGLGFIFGPAIGGALSQIGPTAPFFGAALLAVVNLLIASLFLPETLRRDGTAKAAPKHAFSLVALKEHFRRPGNAKYLFALTFVTTLGFAMMEMTCGLFIEHAWLGDQGLTSGEHIREASRLTAYFLVAVGITATIVQGGLIGRLQKRFGEVALARTGVVLLLVSLALFPTLVGALSKPLFYLAAVMLATGSALLSPSAQALVSRAAGAEEQGETLGLNQSLSAHGRVFGPAAAGVLFGFLPGLPYYVGAVLMAIGTLLTLKLVKPAAA
jgi:MFS family permease